MKLECHCDHCPSNTCTTQDDGFCYAEWVYPSNTVDRIERRYNCFNKDNSLFKDLICDQNVTYTSHVIRRCCNTSLCNLEPGLLPEQTQAYKEFQKLTRNPTYPPLADDNQYSELHLGFKSILIILSVSLVVLAFALAQRKSTAAIRLRRLRRNEGARQRVSPTEVTTGPTSANGSSNRGSGTIGADAGSANGDRGENFFRQGLNYMIDYGRKRFGAPGSENRRVRSNPDPSLIDSNASRSIRGAQRRQDQEDCSERDGAVYDTNSIASREPLINTTNKRLNQTATSKPDYIVNIRQHHSGPHMDEETLNGKSTFQITLGSGLADDTMPDTSSGSGAGQPYLMQRSIAHDIKLAETVGRGYFGVVWRGEYKGESVAVKIFSPVAEPSWERESELYQTTMLRHKNVLGFIASDKRIDAGVTEFWLVTEYHEFGNLQDFITNRTLTMVDALRMAFSIANGLAHLHTEILGTLGKPAIAHRDMKTKNILVKTDGTCCIADLGMAVRHNSNTGTVDVPTNIRAGTRRYLAPEVLDNSLNLMDFDAIKATDIYALGLIMWEIIRRTCLVLPLPNGRLDDDAMIQVQRQVTSPTTIMSDSYIHDEFFGDDAVRTDPSELIPERKQASEVAAPQVILQPTSGSTPHSVASQFQQRQQQQSVQEQPQLDSPQQTLEEQAAKPPEVRHAEELLNTASTLFAAARQQQQGIRPRQDVDEQAFNTSLHAALIRAQYQQHIAENPPPQRPVGSGSTLFDALLQRQQEVGQYQPEQALVEQEAIEHLGASSSLYQALKRRQIEEEGSQQLQQSQQQQNQPPSQQAQPYQIQYHSQQAGGQPSIEPQASPSWEAAQFDFSSISQMLPAGTSATAVQQPQQVAGSQVPAEPLDPMTLQRLLEPTIVTRDPPPQPNPDWRPSNIPPIRIPQPSGPHFVDMSADDVELLAVVCEPYEPPYKCIFDRDPSVEEMRELICVHKYRPQIPDRWLRFTSMREYALLMRECWYEKPQSRLSALRLRKSLADIAKKNFNFNVDTGEREGS